MEEQDWNPNDWQGRTRKQVQANATILSWLIVGATVLIGAFAIYCVLTGKI